MFISLIKYAENGAGTPRPSVSEFLTLEKELLETERMKSSDSLTSNKSGRREES